MMLKFVNIKEQNIRTVCFNSNLHVSHTRIAYMLGRVASLFHTPTCDLLKIQITQHMVVIKSFFIVLDRVEIFGQHAKSCKKQSLTFLSQRKKQNRQAIISSVGRIFKTWEQRMKIYWMQ